MHVTIQFHDAHSLTTEEVVRQAQEAFGKYVKVDCGPDSSQPYDYITFGISQLITHEQLSLWYQPGGNYNTEISNLRAKVLKKLADIVDQVIIENESKVQ